MKMKAGEIKLKCELCGAEYSFGPHLYKGRMLKYYQMAVCNPCYKGNRDGFAMPHFVEKLEVRCKKLGKPIPKRNSAGWLPRNP